MQTWPTHPFPPWQAPLQSFSCSATPGEQTWSGLASLQNDDHISLHTQQAALARTRAASAHPQSHPILVEGQPCPLAHPQ